MGAWLDTETKMLLQRSPPEKLAPPNTSTFALVLLAAQRVNRERLISAVERIREASRDEAAKILEHSLPIMVKRGLSYEDAMLGQFELITCDAISAFLSDEVVDNASESYLAELYENVCRSSEFERIPVRIDSLPVDEKGKEFMIRFIGAVDCHFPLKLTAMKKKARIMEHWAVKIGGQITLG